MPFAEIDLGSIARSSAAVSRSPPKREVPITSDANVSGPTLKVTGNVS